MAKATGNKKAAPAVVAAAQKKSKGATPQKTLEDYKVQRGSARKARRERCQHYEIIKGQEVILSSYRDKFLGGDRTKPSGKVVVYAASQEAAMELYKSKLPINPNSPTTGKETTK